MAITCRHYRGHCEQELEKLEKLRVKRRRDEREEEEGGLRGGRGRVVEVLRERRERRRERRLRNTEGEGGGGECPHCRDQVSWQQFGLGQCWAPGYSSCINIRMRRGIYAVVRYSPSPEGTHKGDGIYLMYLELNPYTYTIVLTDPV